jgi:hypothetical protein
MDCRQCEDRNWRNHYIVAQERFDKVVARLTIGTIIAFTIAVLCLFATIITIWRVQKFINEFEYVEETEIQIEQDCRGENTVILSDDSEVRNGAEVHREKEGLLAEESNNKNNTITVYK